MASSRTDLRFETFSVAGPLGTPDPRAAEAVRAMDYGFLGAPRSDADVIAQLDRFRTDGTVLTTVHDDGLDPRSVGAERPVATFGEFVGSVAVAPGAVLSAQMITEVTVRSTHRRRGILSSLMTDALARAKADGLALSALTASEGGIYGRFGFGVAAYSNHVTVDAACGLRLRPDARAAIEAAGIRVIAATWEALGEAYPDLQATMQAVTPGQTGSTHAYRRRAAGHANAWAVQANAEADLRPLLAIDAAGQACGYALARFSGYDHKPTQLRVRDLGARDLLAEIALWDALAATDLVAEVTWSEAPTDFALPWALTDARDVRFGERFDHLWLRVLDVPAAFTARGLAAEARIILDVADPAGHAAGRWLVECAGGQTRVREAAAAEAPTLRLSAESLASILTGAVSVRTLVAIGRAAASPEHTPALAAALDTSRAPRNAYTF